MPGGPKPKPTHLHIVEGTLNVTRHRKRLKSEPKPVGDLHDPPVHLSERQREIWSQQLRDSPAGLLKRIDWADYLAWVIACDIHRQAVEELNKPGADGLVVLTAPGRGPHGIKSGGNLIQNPLLAIINRQALIMAKLSSELGFSPVSRARVSIDPRVEVNPFDEFA